MKILDGDTLRDMTTDELAAYKTTVADVETALTAQTAADAKAATAQAAAKTSAHTKLAALGLTADEIAAL